MFCFCISLRLALSDGKMSALRRARDVTHIVNMGKNFRIDIGGIFPSRLIWVIIYLDHDLGGC